MEHWILKKLRGRFFSPNQAFRKRNNLQLFIHWIYNSSEMNWEVFCFSFAEKDFG